MPVAHSSILRRLLGLRLLTAAIFVLIVFLSVSFGREIVRGMEIERNIASLRSDVESLSARNLEVTRLATAFQTQSFIEREARLKLGMKKPGEEVVVIQREPTTMTDAPTDGTEAENPGPTDPAAILAQADKPEPVANPAKWWYYFFDQPRFVILSQPYGN